MSEKWYENKIVRIIVAIFACCGAVSTMFWLFVWYLSWYPLN